MSKEKQIEKQIKEMARAMCGNGMPNGNCATDDEPCGLECFYGFCAERLYCKDYRKQEWISVHDRLPAMGENVLCFENGKFYIAFFEKFEEGAWWDWVAFDRDDTWNEVCPSYWMPLPQPPKMKGAKS